MLNWPGVFLGIAAIAGLFGYGGIDASSAEIAQLLFEIFVALFIGAVIFKLLRRGAD